MLSTRAASPQRWTEPKQIVGYMVRTRSGAIENAALYPLSQHAEALDAAYRWNASITALVCAPVVAEIATPE
jgi:hypothetical protein